MWGAFLIVVALGEVVATLILDVSPEIVLGGLVLLVAATVRVVIDHLVFVGPNEALVVCSRWDDRVIRVIEGPDWTVLLPGYEQEGARLDTSYQLQQVPVAELLQTDQQVVVLRPAVYVMYQLEPKRLDLRHLGKLLPYLVNSVSDIVQLWTDYLMRRLVSDMSFDEPDAGVQARLERHLTQLLNEHLGALAVVVHRALLVIRPPAGLYKALTAAEQQRVRITLQGEQLNKLLQALADQHEEARGLALLDLAHSLGSSGQTWTGLDLGGWLGFDGEPGLSLVTGQLPWWPPPIRSTRRAGQAARSVKRLKK